ncbi:hypothetical protein [Rosenbergiella collisarenosi]|uniref:hypothetical protein n=1 Tax=Rosenbergiella collisarenosi TaxID=1544695 RepID=UPI001F4D784B|nr:hypothetical protein [Rosenbergiella collisarenosi]
MSVPAIYINSVKNLQSGNNPDSSACWVYPAQFHYKRDFISYCKSIYSDEENPLIIFIDFRFIPEKFISKFKLDWRYISNFQIADNEDNEESFFIFANRFSQYKYYFFKECFCGEYKKLHHFIEEIAENRYEISALPKEIRNSLDWNKLTKTIMREYLKEGDHIFFTKHDLF